jgi:hypothetical protein
MGMGDVRGPIRVQEFRGRYTLTLPPAFAPVLDFKNVGTRDWLYYGYSDPIMKLWHRDARGRV